MASELADSALKTLVGTARSRRLPPPSTRRAIREAAGISLREAAKALNVDAMTVLRWEKGGDPSRRHAARYQQLLKALKEVAHEQS